MINYEDLITNITEPKYTIVRFQVGNKKPIAQSDRLVPIEIVTPKDDATIEAAVPVKSFWNSKINCMKLYEKDKELEDGNYEMKPNLTCLKRRVDSHEKFCIIVKFEYDDASHRIISKFKPLMEPPRLFAHSKTLVVGDIIYCKYPRDIIPEPTFQIIYQDFQDPGLKLVTRKNEILLIVTDVVKTGNTTIQCIAANSMGSSLFAFSTIKTFTIQGSPTEMVIKPWQQTIFLENSTIECKVKGHYAKSRWMRYSGHTNFKTKTDGSSSILKIEKDNKGLLIGGMHEWICSALGYKNRRHLYQRKLFYVFIPIQKAPTCVDCSDTEFANVPYKRDYRCFLYDDAHFPKAIIKWNFLSGAEDCVYISGNILTLIETMSKNEDIYAECSATAMTYEKNGTKYWKIVKSKVYKFKSIQQFCPFVYEELENTAIVLAVILVLGIIDMYLLQFIYDKWKKGSLK